MRLLLINPKFPESFWSFKFAIDNILLKEKAINPPLGLATLAALTPEGWQIEIVDENIEPLPLNPDADIIGVCGMLVQFKRQREILTYYKNKGYFVVVGGSGASLCPEKYTGTADVVISGEAEYIWKQFCSDFEKGEYKNIYRENGVVDLTHSPTPRFDLLKINKYKTVSLQFSRGCPFNCDFCDIIVMFGRKPRTKSQEQIGKELDVLKSMGVKNIFFVDDNFIGNKKVAKELLKYLVNYQQENKITFNFGTEVSMDLSSDEELLKLMREANFEWVFIGIESPDNNSLKEANKKQNLRMDLLASIKKIYNYGFDIFAGFIVGFDNETDKIFDAHYKFIIESGIQVSMVGLLYAPPKTPLYKRMSEENRINDKFNEYDNTQLGTNILPKNMSYDELLRGYSSLCARLFTNRNIYKKLRNKTKCLKNLTNIVKEDSSHYFRLAKKIILNGIIKGGPIRLFYFILTLLTTKPGLYVMAFTDWVAGISINDYIKRNLTSIYKNRDFSHSFIRAIKIRYSEYFVLNKLSIKINTFKSLHDNVSLFIKEWQDKTFVKSIRKIIKELIIYSNFNITIHIDNVPADKKYIEKLLKGLKSYSTRIYISISEKHLSKLDIDWGDYTLKLV